MSYQNEDESNELKVFAAETGTCSCDKGITKIRNSWKGMELILKGMLKAIRRQKGMGIAVTSLLECLRKAYYSFMYPPQHSQNEVIALWRGTALHKANILGGQMEMPVGGFGDLIITVEDLKTGSKVKMKDDGRLFIDTENGKEYIGNLLNKEILLYVGPEKKEVRVVNVEVNKLPIIGVVDEYKDGVLLEKKTVTKLFGPLQHNIKQVQYYASLLAYNKIPVKEAYILYYILSEDRLFIHEVNLEDKTAELIEKRNILESHLKSKTTPPREVGWMCEHCPYFHICFNEP